MADEYDPFRPSEPPCQMNGTREDSYGNDHYWNCGRPGLVDVEGRLLCEDHAGELGHGPKQEEYGYDPNDDSASAGQVAP